MSPEALGARSGSPRRPRRDSGPGPLPPLVRGTEPPPRASRGGANRLPDRLEQILLVEWLAQICGGAGLPDALAGRVIVMSGDEDDRDTHPVRGQARLKFEPAHAAIQVDVQDEAGRAAWPERV